MLKISICSGGTGGHMFPACALFDSLSEKGHSVTMVTDVRGDRFCGNIGSSHKIVLRTIRFSLGFSIKKLFKLIRDTFSISSQLHALWKSAPPDVIVGFGSSFTIIPILIGKLLGSKIILYEQNSILGKANKFLSRFSDFKVSTFSIDESWQRLPSPVRHEFVDAANSSDYNCDGRIKIVVIGGSQGALSFSSIIPNSLALLDQKIRSDIDIVQQVSTAKIDDLSDAYRKIGVNAKLLDFVHNVAEEMANAQLIISRSGASTLAELSTLGRPAILIPYPLAADNHQFYNALCYKNKGAAWIVEEDDNHENIEKKLASVMAEILGNRELLKKAALRMNSSLKKQSTEVFADFVEKSAGFERRYSKNIME